jgi:hypothetical protein
MIGGKQSGPGRSAVIAMGNVEFQVSGIGEIAAKVRVLLFNHTLILFTKPVFLKGELITLPHINLFFING